MSGIVGSYNLDGRPTGVEVLRSMTDSIGHRGPDGSGVWTDGPVGFGHRMLWTTPESFHERLPFAKPVAGLSITADARIDNREELFCFLDFNGRPKETIGDSELILAAYEEWGEECPKHLLGDFAFAIWDQKRQKLICARDPIGIKPFYYYFDGKTFRWASEPKSIFQDRTIPKNPNLELICQYLLNRFDEIEGTLYEDVYCLPPSHLVVLKNSSLHKAKYWDVDPHVEVHYPTDDQYAEHFLDLFKKAVRARLRSRGDIGVLLSGGLDSSSIASVSQELYLEEHTSGHGLETFSIVFDELPCDERTYIDDLVCKWNLKANYYVHESSESWLDFEKSWKYSDVPYCPILAYDGPILEDARGREIRSVLGGIGGDDLLAADYTHLTDLVSQRKFQKLISQLRHDANCSSNSGGSLFIKYCLRPFVPRTIKRILKKAVKPFRADGIPSWLDNRTIQKARLTQENRKDGIFSVRFPTRSQQQIYNGLRYGWNRLALDVAERFFGNFSIEPRYPFLDRRLVEFCLAIPEEQRWYNDSPKYVLRNAMVGILPESIRKRKDKTEFSQVYHREFRDRQYHKIEKLVSTSVLGRLGLIHSHKLLREFKKYREDKAFQGFLDFLEVFVQLELWFRTISELPEGGN